ncbi:hypothetical protein ACQPU1_07050 [Clostridium paraputrificum]|uniref:hypothetical protein n=1 Tax=Clostridium TaxID=1485 RepID=UPI003D34D232
MIIILYGTYRIIKVLETFWERLFPGIMFLAMIIMCIYQIKYNLEIEKSEDKTKTLYVEEFKVFRYKRPTDGAFKWRKALGVEFIDNDNKKYILKTSFELEKFFFEGLGCTAVCKGKEVVRILAFDNEL